MKFKNRYLLTTFLLICVLFLTFNSLFLNSFAFEVDRTGTVYNIVDGDTIDVSSVGRIRLADINTPEQGEPGYNEASNYLSSLIYQKTVYIDVDDVYGTDVYGRIVAVVYVYQDASHLKNANKALLDSGHAVIWDFDNEFNPYTWTLLVEYPPSNDPPPNDPPPNDPPPSDNLPNTQWIAILGIGTVAAGSGVIIGAYADNSYISKRKRNIKFPPTPINVNQAIKQKPYIRKTPFTLKSAINVKMVKDLRAIDKHVNIRGTVKKINKIHDFTRKDGSKGKVGSFHLSDVTGTIKVVLWDERTSVLDSTNFELGCSINIKNAYCKTNSYHGKEETEIYLSRHSLIEI